MARIFTMIALVVAAVVTQANADTNCQCLFQDGSHCCVWFDGHLSNFDCQQACRNVHRGSDNKACNAGGKFSKVSQWNAKHRQACKDAGLGMPPP